MNTSVISQTNVGRQTEFGSHEELSSRAKADVAWFMSHLEAFVDPDQTSDIESEDEIVEIFGTLKNIHDEQAVHYILGEIENRIRQTNKEEIKVRMADLRQRLVSDAATKPEVTLDEADGSAGSNLLPGIKPLTNEVNAPVEAKTASGITFDTPQDPIAIAKGEGSKKEGLSPEGNKGEEYRSRIDDLMKELHAYSQPGASLTRNAAQDRQTKNTIGAPLVAELLAWESTDQAGLKKYLKENSSNYASQITWLKVHYKDDIKLQQLFESSNPLKSAEPKNLDRAVYTPPVRSNGPRNGAARSLDNLVGLGEPAVKKTETASSETGKFATVKVVFGPDGKQVSVINETGNQIRKEPATEGLGALQRSGTRDIIPPKEVPPVVPAATKPVEKPATVNQFGITSAPAIGPSQAPKSQFESGPTLGLDNQNHLEKRPAAVDAAKGVVVPTNLTAESVAAIEKPTAKNEKQEIGPALQSKLVSIDKAKPTLQPNVDTEKAATMQQSKGIVAKVADTLYGLFGGRRKDDELTMQSTGQVAAEENQGGNSKPANMQIHGLLGASKQFDASALSKLHNERWQTPEEGKK